MFDKRWHRGAFIAFLVLFSIGVAYAEDKPEYSVKISGIDGKLLENVEAYLGIYQAIKPPPLLERIDPLTRKTPRPPISLERFRRLYHRASSEIEQALQPYGYYEPIVDRQLVNDDNQWTAQFDIKPGPAVSISKLDIHVEGACEGDDKMQLTLKNVSLETGQQLSHAAYERTKKKLYESAYNRGCIDARFTLAELKVIPAQRSAEISITLDTGKQYYFGPIKFEQDIIKPSLAERFLNFQPGDIFNTDKLLVSQLRLNDSGYFQQVNISVERDLAENEYIPVTVETEPAKSQRYSFGLGYGTDTGPRVKTGVMFERLNQSGHQFLTSLQWSEVKQTFSSQYLIPIGDVAIDRLAISVALQDETFGDVNSRQWVAGPSLITDWLGFRRRLYLNFMNEDYSFDSGDSDVANLIFPGVTLTRKKSDDAQFPTRGYSLNADLHGGAELSNTSFLRTSLEARSVLPIGNQSRLLMRLDLGGLATDSFNELPPSQRFYAGGDRSIRGYKYQSVGSTNSNGDIVGGKYLAAGSLEIDRMVYGNYGAALFFDIGDAFDGTPDFRRSFGVGFRWRLPVGMLRVDFAHPMDDPDTDYRLHISIGPDL